MPAIWFDVASDVPGGSSTLTCTLPSLNGGKKSRPSCVTVTMLNATAAATMPRIGQGCRTLRRIANPAMFFRMRTSRPSCSWAMNLALGSSQ